MLLTASCFFSSDLSAPKVRELAQDAHVLLTYADPGANRYVAVKGLARSEHNPGKARELWNVHAKGWWPEGPESDNLAVIRVRVTGAEWWDGPSNTSYTLNLLKAVVTGERVSLRGDHGKIGR